MEERNVNRYDFDSEYASAGLTLNQYIARTFGWMFLGLMVTFVLAAVLAVTGTVFYLFAIPGIQYILLIAELAVVLIMSHTYRTARWALRGCCSRCMPSSTEWCSRFILWCTKWRT